MNLPDDVLHIIRAYAQPLTRPDWRTLHKLTKDKYLAEYDKKYLQRLDYINNHPQRDSLPYRPTLFRYKNVFCGYNYARMIRL